jgi:hypothetical protein
VNGNDGVDGLSAYEIAVNNGYEFPESIWLSSLQGAIGPEGNDGIDAVVDYDSLASHIIADSIFLANVSGGVGGNCNFQFPEGLEGEGLNIVLNSSSGYTVPLGKRLYILDVTNALSFLLNGLLFNPTFDIPLIASSGDELNATGNSGKMRGLLVDENLGLEALTFPLNTETDGYTVPLGKKFYVTFASSPFSLNGVNFYYNNIMTILNSGDVVTYYVSDCNINGYLVDENHFTNCSGGGSSSSTSNATIDSLTQVVSTLDSTLTAFTSFFTLGCTDVSYAEFNPLANLDDGTCNHSIGDTYQGGILFYLDENGGGLIAAPTDQGFEVEWGCNGSVISGADGSSIGAGAQNTLDIIAGCSQAGIAAALCANLSLDGYNDWFLPSTNELYKMYLNIGWGSTLGNVGGFLNNNYWSSSEYNNFGFNVWYNNLIDGYQSFDSKNTGYSVRAVRAF